jgi:hypothetical protein
MTRRKHIFLQYLYNIQQYFYKFSIHSHHFNYHSVLIPVQVLVLFQLILFHLLGSHPPAFTGDPIGDIDFQGELALVPALFWRSNQRGAPAFGTSGSGRSKRSDDRPLCLGMPLKWNKS